MRFGKGSLEAWKEQKNKYIRGVQCGLPGSFKGPLEVSNHEVVGHQLI